MALHLVSRVYRVFEVHPESLQSGHLDYLAQTGRTDIRGKVVTPARQPYPGVPFFSICRGMLAEIPRTPCFEAEGKPVFHVLAEREQLPNNFRGLEIPFATRQLEIQGWLRHHTILLPGLMALR